MLYVATSHPSSAQLGALKLPFFSPSSETLVINKLSRLEFHEVSPADGGLKLVEEVKLHGGVAALEAVQLPNHPTASLLVLTTSLTLFCLSYDASTSSIVTVSSTSLAEPFARLSEYQAILVSPCGSAAVVYAYDGLARVIPLRPTVTAGGGGKMRRVSTAGGASAFGENGTLDLSMTYNVRLQALNVLSLAFIPSSTSPSAADAEEGGEGAPFPILAVLSTSPMGGKSLSTFTLNLANKELDESTAPIGETALEDAGAEVLVAVEKGVVAVGEESVTWYGVEKVKEGNGKGKGKAREKEKTKEGRGKAVAKMPVSRITAYALLTPTTLLLGDLYGKLLLVTLSFPSSSSPVPPLSVQDLGDATSATSIVPLPGGQVYLSSRFGDSQVVRLPASLTCGVADAEKMDVEGQEGDACSELELVESYTGLAPIVDAVVLGGGDGDGGEFSSDGESSSLLLLSGAYKTGSLRLLRRGLGVSELASLELDGIQRVWCLRRGGETMLVVGLFGETRVLKLEITGGGGADEEVDVEEVEDVPPFSGGVKGTLLAANVGELLVHVTPAGIAFAGEDGGGEGKWAPEGGKRKVTAAVAREGRVAVAVEGGEVVLLEAKNGEGLVQVGSVTFDIDISALALSASSGSTPVLAVALWTPSQTVHLLSVPSLVRLTHYTLSSTFLIRSLALPTFASSYSADASPALLCGLGDGSLTTFSLSLSAETVAIDTKSEKTVQLGRRPLILTEIDGAEGEPAVFVASERPTVVSMAKGGRLSYASVNFSDLTAVASLPISSSPSPSNPLLALASPASLTLGRLALSSSSSGEGIDVRTIPLDEDEPRRIAHERKGRTLAVVCSRRDVDRESGEQTTTGRVRIVEEGEFETRATLTLPSLEEGQSIAPFRFPSTPSTSSLFLLGTTKLDLSTPEPTEGQLVLLRSTPGSEEVEQLASRSIGGCPYAVVGVKGEGMEEYVAVAVNSQVAVFRVLEQDGKWELRVVATWSGAFVALSLAAAPSGVLVVGDALRSITALRFSLPSTSSAAGVQSAALKPRLEELGKDYRSRYMVGVESLSSFPPSPSTSPSSTSTSTVERFLGAETDLNLFTVERDPQAGVRNLADAGILTPGGAWHLGEMVTRFRPGPFGQLLGGSTSTGSSSSLSIVPQHVFTTSAGSVGVIVELDEETSRVLSGLERNLRAIEGVGKGVGGLEQEDFRAFKSDKQRLPSTGFIDGSFVETFLDLSREEQEKAVQGKSEHQALGVKREDVVRLLEEVARAH
ncbi:hypothetical protein JCM8547_008132 [Rhodosporidiobolus lusitaniae]